MWRPMRLKVLTRAGSMVSLQDSAFAISELAACSAGFLPMKSAKKNPTVEFRQWTVNHFVHRDLLGKLAETEMSCQTVRRRAFMSRWLV